MNFLMKKCFCCSLQIGAVVVGIFSLLSGFVGFFQGVVALSRGKSNDDNMDDNTEDTGTPTYSILLIISSILTISAAVLVLIAARKNDKHKFLLPWLILNPLSAFTGIGFSIYFAVLHWIEQEMAVGMGFVAASVAIAALGIFCWLVILSYYFELREVNKKNIAKNLPEV